MPARRVWQASDDETILAMRNNRCPWDQIALALGISRFTVIERGRHIGASLGPAPETVPEIDDARRPMRPGHPTSWGAITNGTVLDGAFYRYRSPLAGACA